ncbi:MAG: hypothetical protein PHU85_01925 [Phycisphaerae bacterium]|nr:hypothetical protein [Phycisphaerae bacterium]
MDVPNTLSARPHWILWRYSGPDRRKVPFQTNGTPAKSNDSTTWTTLAQATASLNGTYSGLGYVFAPGDGIFGVDLDGCIDAAGKLQGWACEILSQFCTYAEVSPSGTGVKLFGLGSLHGTGKKRVLDVPAVCGRKPAVEAYDRGRFFCFTGVRVPEAPKDLSDCQAALDAFCARFWPVPVAPVASFPSMPPGDIVERARRYLAKMPPAVSGQAGHNTTFRAACVLVLGFGLSPDAAYPILAEWNAGCQPPWNEKDLRHKLDDAHKKTGERGWILTGRGYQGNDIDLRALLASLDAPAVDPLEIEPEPERIVFPNECITGAPWLMKLAYKYAVETAIKPQPQLTFAALLALFGAIFGRLVCDDYGTRTNIMVLGLSPSGSGKEHPRKVNKEILFHCGLENINGPERIGSHAGIVTSLCQHPVRLFQIDEIGRLLATMRDARAAPHLYSIGTVLMALYSSSDSMWTGDAYADLTKVKRINQPCCCLFGTSVPEGFYGNLTPQNLSDGLLARMIVLESEGYGTRRKPLLQPLPTELVETIKAWRAKAAIGGNLVPVDPAARIDPELVRKTTEADTRHEQYCEEVHARHTADDATGSALWSRAPEKAAKLALIYACADAEDLKPTITIEAIDWGRRIANYTTRLVLRSVVRSVSLSRWDEEKKRAWQSVVNGMTSSDFTRKTQWIRTRERQEILSDWEASGAIQIVTETTSGRPKTTIKKLRSSP